MDYLGPKSDEKGLYETRSEGMEERRRCVPTTVRDARQESGGFFLNLFLKRVIF